MGRNLHNFNAVNKLLSSALYDLKRIEDLISLPVQHGTVWDEISARAEVIVAAAPSGQARDLAAKVRRTIRDVRASRYARQEDRHRAKLRGYLPLLKAELEASLD